MNKSIFWLSGVLLATGATVAACVSTTAVGKRSEPKLTAGVLAELTPEQLESRNSKGDLPPADLRPVHARGLDLTKRSEGWVPKLYNDAAGYCTIGYGHLIKKIRCNGTEDSGFKPRITQDHGTRLLIGDMAIAQQAVIDSVKVPINDYQYSALTDFVYNTGGKNFRSSTLLKKINAGQFAEVPGQLMRWTKAGGTTYPGLVTRRRGEIDLFLYGQDPKQKELASKAIPAADESAEVDIVTGEMK
jgi:lysozyme